MELSAKTSWNPEARELLRALIRLRTVPQARRFIRDLMTEDEIRMIVDRWRVARMLHEGRSYRDISDETGLSSRTIARISRWLREGEGGYRAMLTRADRRAGKSGRRANGTSSSSVGGLAEHRSPARSS